MDINPYLKNYQETIKAIGFIGYRNMDGNLVINKHPINKHEIEIVGDFILPYTCVIGSVVKYQSKQLQFEYYDEKLIKNSNVEKYIISKLVENDQNINLFFPIFQCVIKKYQVTVEKSLLLLEEI